MEAEWEELCRRRDLRRLYCEVKGRRMEEWRQRRSQRKNREEEEKRSQFLRDVAREEHERRLYQQKEKEESVMKEVEMRRREEELRQKFVEEAYMRRRMEAHPRYREIYSEELTKKLADSRNLEMRLRLETLSHSLEGTVSRRARRSLEYLVGASAP